MANHTVKVHLVIFWICIITILLVFIPVGEIFASPSDQEEPPEDDAGIIGGYIPDATPEPLLDDAPAKEIPGFVNQIVVYNAESEEEIYLPTSDGARSDSGESAFFQPAFLPESEDLSRSFSSLTEVGGYDSWPNTPIVKLFMLWPSGNWSECSGALIDSNHVITAAHCIYTFRAERCDSPASSCWASDTRVLSGYNSGDYTIASERISSGLWTYTGWTSTQDLDFDIAVVQLKYPIGGSAGWYGFGYNNTDSYFTDNTFRSTGFPAESPYDGSSMYTWSGTFDTISTYQLDHDDYSYGGQSGSAVYNSGNTIYGVLSHGTSDPTYPFPHTAYTRITSGKYTDIGNYIAANTSDVFDLAIFNVSVGPETFDRGDSLTSLAYNVFNMSTVNQPSASYRTDWYLSTNDNISEGDTFLQTRYGTWTFDAKTGTHVNSTTSLPTIPSDLCVSGTSGAWYYIGAILDYGDVDAANNETDFYQAARIWINACDEYEYDDTWDTASVLYPAYDFHYKDIIPAADEDWVTFTIAEESNLELRTSGDEGNDTVLYLYDSDRNEIDYNDDIDISTDNYFSMITRSCDEDPLPAGTYYAKVISYNQAEKIEDYWIQLATESCDAAGENYNFIPLFLHE
ncbi:trypsin-like serine protease [bacterium]|nr:trypsin-like serine protease [bacterium]